MPRKYTNELLEKIDNQELTADEVLRSLVDFLPEDTIEDFCLNGDYSEMFEEDEDDDTTLPDDDETSDEEEDEELEKTMDKLSWANGSAFKGGI